MENNLTTRTYTAPTCTLIVSSKQPRSGDRQQPQPIDFILHLERDELDELDDLTLNGQPQQLAYLHQLVSEYIAALVAKFPISNPERSAPAPADLHQLDSDETIASSQPEPTPSDRSSRFGILNNLPGLRNSLAKLTPASKIPTANKPSISKLLSGKKPHDRQQVSPDKAQSTPERPAATAPYFTGGRNRPLDHQLYLGNLATLGSGEVLTLSAIQLFDLATVLDEYVAEHQILSDDLRTATFSRTDIPVHGDRVAEFNPISTPQSRPNSPNAPAEPVINQVYYRTRRSKSSFISAIPWAVAAALAVGVPLLILDPHSNPIKDAVSKVKIFAPIKKSDLATAKKPAPATLPSTPTNLAPTAPAATAPTPWQAQPVQPPQVIQTPANINPPQNPSTLGTAPLPEAIATKPATAPTTTASGENVLSGIAANPLNSTQPPVIPEKIDSTIERKTTPPVKIGAKPERVMPSSVVPSPATTRQPGQIPATTATKTAAPGKLSVSKRPMLIPSPNLSPIVIPQIAAPIPFNPPVLDLPSEQPPQTPKPATNQKVKPTPIASKTKPKPAKSIDPGVSSTPNFEPVTPIPKNPNLINPNQNPEPAESQAPPIVPDKPLQSNAGGANAEAADAASLQETKRYFQGKWKATSTQTNSLQYVVQVSGKSGIVRNVSPQGEAATAYLQQTKFVKPGQKLISPAAAGSSDRKIRVLLQPDGNVDTFTEP